MILAPVRYGDLLLDARSVLLSLAALFLGPLPSLLAFAVASLYRVYTGGPAVTPAIIVMSVSVLVGLLWRWFRTPEVDKITFVELYLFGLTVHFVIVMLAYITPPALLLVRLKGVAEPLLLVLPVAEVVIGGLLVRFARQEALAQTIKDSEERYRLLADNVTDMIIQHDLEGRIEYVSPSVIQLGYEPGDVTGLVRFDFIHDDDVDRLRKRMLDVGRGIPCDRIDARVRTADGHWVWIESIPSPVRDADGKIVGILSVCRDVTARMETEEALREMRAEMARVTRISALGAFSASLAHEINQPLAALAISSEMAQRLLKTEPPDLAKISRSVERSARDARRASEIVARMRSLTARRPVQPTDFDLGEAITETLALARAELVRWKIDVEGPADAERVMIHGDRIQIQQVVLNLVQNAIEAMHDTPEVDRWLRIGWRVVGGEVRIEVEDRGPGLDPITAGSAFEHLFTTKENGTGLGLAISKSIVEAHSGRIWIEKAEPRGAVFKVQLPQRAD
jgi:PAS domain S-box-containing protein